MIYKFKTNNQKEAYRLLKAEDMAKFIHSLQNHMRLFMKNVESEEIEAFFTDFTAAVYDDLRDLNMDDELIY